MTRVLSASPCVIAATGRVAYVLAISGVLVLTAGCSGTHATGNGAASSQLLRPNCPDDQFWNGRECQIRGPGATELDQGAAALSEFRVEQALAHLTRALAQGPHRYRDLVRIYENLGITYSYTGDKQRALQAFDMLLTLAPEHLLRYTLSPQVTFVFEEARTKANERRRPEIHVSWPYDLDVSRPVPLEVEVVADPKRYLKSARLAVRRRGETQFSATDIALPSAGEHVRVSLPPVTGNRSNVLEIYLTATDADGNQVLEWASPKTPREIALGYTAPHPWYRKWWIWAAVGTAVAVGTGATVYAVAREPPDTVGGTLVFDN